MRVTGLLFRLHRLIPDETSLSYSFPSVLLQLTGIAEPYHLLRGGRDLRVFCFAVAEAAQAFHSRLGGELLPVVEEPPRGRRRRPTV